MVAIITKWVGPTNHKPSRIIVTSNAGKHGRTVVSWNHELDVEANHLAAARHHSARNEWDQGWHGELVGGATTNGYAFVFVKRDPKCTCHRWNLEA